MFFLKKRIIMLKYLWLMFQICLISSNINELNSKKRKLHHMDSSVMVNKADKLLGSLKKKVFNKNEIKNLLLKIYSKIDLKEMEKIERLIKEKKALDYRQDHNLFMVHKIDDFLLVLKKTEFSRDDVLEIFDKNLFLEFIQKKIDKTKEDDYILHPKDREYLDDLPNTIYDYHEHPEEDL